MAQDPPLARVPPSMRGARLGVDRRALVGVLAIVVLAAALFGVRVMRSAAAASPLPVPPGSAVVARTSTAFATQGSAVSSATATSVSVQIVVHVVGKVRRPGIVRLPTGSRVVDAVAAAGGTTAGADLSAINLARPVVDGEQIRVPAPGEHLAPSPVEATGGTSPGGSTGRVNLNTADLAVLDGLPGVGPVLAQRILDWRTEHGRFTSIDELGEVSGIGEKMLAQLSAKVTVG